MKINLVIDGPSELSWFNRLSLCYIRAYMTLFGTSFHAPGFSFKDILKREGFLIALLVQKLQRFCRMKKKKKRRKKLCHVSCVKCCVSPVTNANSQRHRPSLANSPTMHSRLVRKDRMFLFVLFLIIKIIQTIQKFNRLLFSQY